MPDAQTCHIWQLVGFFLLFSACSVNMKERLDFSCALFGPEGSLIANAPHLPVHLGAMSDAVKFQVEQAGCDTLLVDLRCVSGCGLR